MRIILRVGDGRRDGIMGLGNITRNIEGDIRSEVQFRLTNGDGADGSGGGGLANVEPKERGGQKRKIVRAAVRSALAKLKGFGK